MQLPKNVMQIGEPGKSPYIYIEDYAYTYIRQIAKSDTEGWHKINLYGESAWENNTQYYFVYAALPEMEESEEKRRKFFPEYRKLGTLKIQDTIMEFSFWEKEPRIAGGFYVFFEKNLPMQSYMIWEHENKENESIKRIEKVSVVPRKEYAPKNKESNLFTGLTAVMGVLVCAIVVLTMNRYEKMKEAKDYNAEVIENLQITPTYTEEFVQVATEETLTEESVPAWAEIPEETTSSIEQEVETQVTTPEYAEYVIEEGDTLMKICVNFYGSDSRVEEICQLNNIQNPDNIKPGEKILLP